MLAAAPEIGLTSSQPSKAGRFVLAAHVNLATVLFEGRDAAGKGRVIKRVTQRLNPRICKVWRCPRPPSANALSGIFSAMRPSAGSRGNRPVRPQLVQPGRRRTGHGILLRRRLRRILSHNAGTEASAGLSAPPDCQRVVRADGVLVSLFVRHEANEVSCPLLLCQSTARVNGRPDNCPQKLAYKQQHSTACRLESFAVFASHIPKANEEP